ncbi:MAG: hypothetical protein WCS58_07145, partial [Candidatus Cloacimonadaceae bacterium]
MLQDITVILNNRIDSKKRNDTRNMEWVGRSTKGQDRQVSSGSRDILNNLPAFLNFFLDDQDIFERLA